ncbi:MAG: FAD-dependent oxidoreductase [Nocardioides sp.]|jgi:glycine/D-amino acid oxidase-like deaminating enzyme
MDRSEADVAVIGAGVMGCAIAYELSRLGNDVLVLERDVGAGSGSTSASSAIVRFNYSTVSTVAASWESLHRWQAWSDYLGADPGEPLAAFVRTGGLVLPAPVQDSELVLSHFDTVGIPYERWSADRIRQELPWLDPVRHYPPKPVDSPDFWATPDGDELSGIWVPDAGFVDDPRLAAQNLMDAARRHGARFRFRSGVVAVHKGDGRVTGVELADGTQVRAPVVVNASGPHSAIVNAMAGALDDFAVHTRPLRQEVHEVPAPPGYAAAGPGPFVADPDLGTYFRGTPSGRLLVGGTEPECDPMQWLDDPDAVDVHVTREVYEAQLYRAARRLPGLTVPGKPVGITGIYDVSDDWSPIYDRTCVDGFYVAVGTSGNQFKNAPVVGEFLAQLIRACESGHDHDREPLRLTLARTGLEVDLGTYSRRRSVGPGAGVLG